MSNCTNNFIKRVIGVTRTFKWTITTNSAAVPLVAEDLTLQLVPPRGEAVSLPFDVDDNIVSFTWQGEDQHIIGCYSLILWANYGEDNQRRVDIHNFVELIPWSDRQSGEYSDLVEETIELETADFGENIMVVDNLNSTSATDALSANMGRQLNVTKQDVIQDLAAIRSGAAAGAAVKEWAKNDPLITDDGTQVSASKLSFNGNIFEQWVPGIASSIGLKGIAGFLKLADISQWDSAYNDRMLPTVAAVKAKLQAVLTALATIEAVIPSQASSTNKLTDKDYVDGAIATNTANFVGTFDTLAELQAVQNPTKNDYGFVIEQDAQGNEYYDRYKYTGTQWMFEYKVESTPFTTEQWAAIQSGITAALVSKLSALPTNAELNTALAAKQPVINDLTTIRSGAAAGATAYQKPSGGIPKTDLASAVQTSLGKADAAAPQSTTYTKAEVDAALATKQPVINDLTTIRSGAAAGATAYQKPSGGIPKTDLANAVQTSLGKADAALSRSDMATINGSDITHGGNVTIVAAEGQTITIDATPTAGSSNAVSSGGVYERELGIESKIDGIAGYVDFEKTFINTTTPDGYTELAKLRKMFGNSIVWNQMTYGHFVNNVNAPWNLYNVRKVSCADGILQISPNSAGATARIYRTLSLISGHKYCCRYWIKVNTEAAQSITATWGFFNGSTVNIQRDSQATNQWFQVNAVVTPSSTATQIHIGLYYGSSAIATTDSVEIKDVNIFDLTTMFGVGKEPTADEFLRMYPSDYYEPTAAAIKNVCPTKLTSTNGFDSFELNLTNYELAAVAETRDELDLENGILTRRIGSRVYQSGDESDTSVLTDGNITLYALESESTQSISQQNIVRTFENGTLSFSACEITAPVPTIMSYGIDPSTSLQHGEQAYQDCLTYERLIKTTAYTTTPTENYYINYSTGKLTQAGGTTQMEMYRVPLDGVLLLDVYVGALDTIPAAIAYYKSTTISASNYMQSASVQMIAGAHSYQSAVPEGAVLAVVSNRKINVPNPIIKITRADSILTPIETSVLTTAKSREYQHTPFLNAPWYAHHAPIGFVKDGNNNNIIAGESLASIRMAARLGFKYIEANIQKTADDHYITIHGVGTGFGSMCYSIDGNDPTTMVIGNLTLAYIQENIRYNSAWDKYKTTIPTLEEFLDECKANGIGIVASALYEDAVQMCIDKLGQDGVVLYNPQPSCREYFSGLGFYYINSTTTKDSLLEIARSYGRPFAINIGPTAKASLENDGMLEEWVADMHQEGFLCAFAYMGEEGSAELLRLGFDLAASEYQVNNFEPSEVYDINTPTNINCSETISNGSVTLPANGTLSCGYTTAYPLGEGMLRIRFNGTLTFDFGTMGPRTYTSDGTYTLTLSDIFLLRKPQLTIIAMETTLITDFVYQFRIC